MAIDISVIAVFHDEGLLAHRTLLSVRRSIESAARRGLTVETVCVLDEADRHTAGVVRETEVLRVIAVETSFGCPGPARNRGIEEARGRLVTVVDGDDYVSADWLPAAAAIVLAGGPKVIARPEYVVNFGATETFVQQIGQDDPLFDADSLLSVSPWIMPSMAHREVFLDHPYAGRRGSGFGYEDWHWNCETVAAGFEHRLAAGTAYYYRRKADGVLAKDIAGAKLIGASRLFERCGRS